MEPLLVINGTAPCVAVGGRLGAGGGGGTPPTEAPKVGGALGGGEGGQAKRCGSDAGGAPRAGGVGRGAILAGASCASFFGTFHSPGGVVPANGLGCGGD